MAELKKVLGLAAILTVVGASAYYWGRKNAGKVALTGVALSALTFGYMFREPLKEAISHVGKYKITAQEMDYKKNMTQMDLDNQIKSKELDYKHEEIMNGKIVSENEPVQAQAAPQIIYVQPTPVQVYVQPETKKTEDKQTQIQQIQKEEKVRTSNNIFSNKKRSFSNYEIDIDRSEHTFRLYKKFSDGLEELVKEGPVSLASNGGPGDIYSKIYSIEERAGDLYPEIMRFDRNKPYLVITGEGRNGTHRYEIENRMDANKTGVRMLNEDYCFVKAETGNNNIFVDVHQ